MQTRTEPAVALGDIGQIALAVRDLALSKEFYRDVLGMKFLFDTGTMAFFQCGAVRLMLGIGERPASTTGTIVYFKVDQIEDACARLRARGVTFVQGAHCTARMPDHDLWLAFVKDPEGNVLGLMSEVMRGASKDN